MGREVRKVRGDWQHPKDAKGHYLPLFEGKRLRDWDEGKAQWEKGFKPDYRGGWIEHGETYPYEDYAGQRPLAENCMPQWSAEEADHLMMYEDTSEGTPLSPAFKTPEELARWLADNGASACGYDTATYAQWLATIGDGFAVSMVFDNEKGMRSGVAFSAESRQGGDVG